MKRFFVTIAAAVVLLLIAAAPRSSAQTANPAARFDTLAGDYEVLPDVVYGRANKTDLRLDLYLPRDRRRGATPVVVFFHGGGWVEGRKESDALLLLPYLSMNVAVANVEYRLGRDTPAPAAVEDCRCALRWIARNAARNNIDSNRIVLTGFSAGGHLALVTGLLPAGSEFDRACPTDEAVRWREGTEPEIKIAGVINWYGIADVNDLLAGKNAKHYAIEWFGSRADREELARRVSPLTYVRREAPPVLSIHGDADDVVPYDHSARLHRALQAAGVPNKLVTIRGGKHGGFDPRETANAYRQIREFLRERDLVPAEAADVSAGK